jgi:hypothetical protein
MHNNPYQAKNSHFIVAAIQRLIGKLRQNPDVYPIKYYKKNRRLRDSNIIRH